MSGKSSEGFVRSRRAGVDLLTGADVYIVGKDVCCSVVQYLIDSETELRSKWWLLQ